MGNNNHEQLLALLIPERENKIARGKMIKLKQTSQLWKL